MCVCFLRDAQGVMESVVRRAEAIATRFEENPSLDNFALVYRSCPFLARLLLDGYVSCSSD
jgi:hypothetical protein